MRLENLDNIVWKCCLVKDDDEKVFNENDVVEISGNIEEFQNNNHALHDFIRNTIDNNLVDLLDELYCIKGLEKLDSVQCEGKSDKIKLLKEMSNQYNALLKFKQFYYAEVQESINKINCYIDNNKKPKRNYRWYWLNFWDLEELYREVFYFLRYFNISPSLFEEIITKMNKVLVDEYKSKRSIFHEKNIGLWISLLELFREDVFGVDGEIIWLISLCVLAQMICRDDIHCLEFPFEGHMLFEEMLDDYNKRQNSYEDFLELLNFLIKKTTRLVDETTASRMVEKQRNLLLCYQYNSITKELFDIKAKSLIKALKSNAKLRDKYLSKSGTGCIAIMHHDSKRYVAISGEDSHGKHQKIEKLLDNKYINVTINEGTRFYCNEKQYVTYKAYENWLIYQEVNRDLLNDCVKRMFSCCERKLLTKVYGSNNSKFTLYVKKKPCILCEDALKQFSKNRYCTVNYVKSGKKNMNKKVLAYLKLLGNLIACNRTTSAIYDKSF